MLKYRNLSGQSGIVGYELHFTHIVVHFNDGRWYRYDGQKPGPQVVARMKQLAAEGIGLNSFISRVVKKSYSAWGRRKA